MDAEADTCAVCGLPLRLRSYGAHGVARLRCCTVVYRDSRGKAARGGAYVHDGVRYLPTGLVKVLRVERARE